MGRRALESIWKTFEEKLALILINSELLRGLEGSYKVFFLFYVLQKKFVFHLIFFLDLNFSFLLIS